MCHLDLDVLMVTCLSAKFWEKAPTISRYHDAASGLLHATKWILSKRPHGNPTEPQTLNTETLNP